jgi:hypothetical protein
VAYIFIFREIDSLIDLQEISLSAETINNGFTPETINKKAP